MNITISIPGDGSALKGTVDVTATAQPTKQLQRLDLFVDGAILGSSSASPYVYRWDTTLVADGSHTLRADAIYKQRVSTASIQVKVANASAPPPDPEPPPTEYPASFFTGPLGVANVVPKDPDGALIIMWSGVAGASEQAQRDMHLQRMTDANRSWDGIQFQGSGLTVGGQDGFDWCHSLGILPCHTWNPGSTIQNIVAGAQNTAIDAEINKLKAKPYRVMVRLMHEFNLSNVSYYHQGNPPLWVDAWRYVVERFAAQGVQNVGFWWCPVEVAGAADRDPVDACYPGDAYVDWVGADRYNHNNGYSTPLHGGWAEFSELMDYDRYGYARLSICSQYGPAKPYIQGETGSRYDSGNVNRKANWWRAIDSDAKQNEPLLRGVAFFDVNTGSLEWNNWRVDSNQTLAMKQAQSLGGVDAVTYQGFKDLAGTPAWNVGIA